MVAPQASDGDLLTGEKRRELLNLYSEQLPERTRIAAEANVVVLVHDAGEPSDDERPASLHVLCDSLGSGVGHQVEVGNQQQPEAVQLGLRVDEVAGDPLLPQCPVPGPDLGHQVHVGAGMEIHLQTPPALPVEEHGHIGFDPSPGDLGQRLQLAPEGDDLPPLAGVGP